MVKISLRYGAILGTVALCCAAAVSGLQVIVEPVIVRRTEEKVRENLGRIYAGVPFEYDDVSTQFRLDGTNDIDKLYRVRLGSGEINFVYELSPKGRNADILYLLAFDTTGTIKQIQYVQMRETRGRGDKITFKEYLEKLYGQKASAVTVDIITGATYSTKAMKSSIEASSNHLIAEVLK